MLGSNYCLVRHLEVRLGFLKLTMLQVQSCNAGIIRFYSRIMSFLSVERNFPRRVMVDFSSGATSGEILFYQLDNKSKTFFLEKF